MKTWLIDSCFKSAVERLSAERTRLQFLSTAGNGRTPQATTARKAAKAYCFVHIAAILEDLFRSLDESIAQDLTSTSAAMANLPFSVRSFVDSKLWQGLNDNSSSKLANRNAVIQTINSHRSDLVSIASSLTALGVSDGNTICETHFQAVWIALSLDDDPFPSLAHKTAIKEIRELRNDVAHWRKDPQEVGARRQYPDLIRSVDLTTESVEHLYLHLLTFLDAI